MVALAGAGFEARRIQDGDIAARGIDKAGFGDVRVETLANDILNFYYIARRAGAAA